MAPKTGERVVPFPLTAGLAFPGVQYRRCAAEGQAAGQRRPRLVIGKRRDACAG
jgi:hypothetical protein